MKRVNFIIIINLFIFLELANALTLYESGENGNSNGWSLQNRSRGEEAKNIYSPSLASRVIRLEGQGGPWILGAVSGDLAWKNGKEKWISWKMVTTDRYTVYIPITTKNGTRYLFYNDLPKRILRHGVEGGILHGLGGYKHKEYKSVWRDYTRNLEADLKDSEPDNELISVNGFIYSGSNVSIDNILLYNPKETVYENGSNAQQWKIVGSKIEGASVTSIQDPQGEHAQGDVIEVNGSKLDTGFKIDINNSTDSIISWKSRFYEVYQVSLIVDTEKGERELLYINSSRYIPSGGMEENGYTIWHELGGKSLVGENGWEQGRDFGRTNHFWQNVVRDLNQDIRDFEKDNRLISLKSFEIRGSGLIDDIKMVSRPEVPNPRDEIVYEDGEDGEISRWTIYDNSPKGAKVINVLDDNRGKVISFDGNGFENGYEIGARRGDSRWNSRDHKIMSWSMSFNQPYSVYVAIATEGGARYLTYEPRDKDRGVSGSYIRFGVGKDTLSGEWVTATRNIEEDLKQFEPDNNLIAINGLLVRGNGKIDDIKSMFNQSKSVIYEDAEDGNIDGWRVMRGSSKDANISNIKDNDRNSSVISLSGRGKSDGYIFGGTWNNMDSRSIRWSMKFSEDYSIYITVRTKNGIRYMTYTPRDSDKGIKGDYIIFGLGEKTKDGTWQTISRDLEKDIQKVEKENRLISIDGIKVRGSGYIDDIETF